MYKWMIMILSFLLSLLLSIAPLPENLMFLNPSWYLLTLLFWTYAYPRMVNVGIAWCVGIIMDGMTGSLLGLHAFAGVITVYMFDIFYRRFHMFHLLQQSLVIGVLVACNFMIMFGIEHMLTNHLIVWSLVLGAISSAFCWPFYQIFGQKFHLRKG